MKMLYGPVQVKILPYEGITLGNKRGILRLLLLCQADCLISIEYYVLGLLDCSVIGISTQLQTKQHNSLKPQDIFCSYHDKRCILIIFDARTSFREILRSGGKFCQRLRQISPRKRLEGSFMMTGVNLKPKFLVQFLIAAMKHPLKLQLKSAGRTCQMLNFCLKKLV